MKCWNKEVNYCSECTVQGSIIPHKLSQMVINMAVYRAALFEPLVSGTVFHQHILILDLQMFLILTLERNPDYKNTSETLNSQDSYSALSDSRWRRDLQECANSKTKRSPSPKSIIFGWRCSSMWNEWNIQKFNKQNQPFLSPCSAVTSDLLWTSSLHLQEGSSPFFSALGEPWSGFLFALHVPFFFFFFILISWNSWWTTPDLDDFEMKAAPSWPEQVS